GAALGARLEDGFLARLEPARANRDHETGVALYRRAARGAAATPARVAATAALLALHGEAAEVPGYTLRFSAGPADGRLAADAEVREEATGATARVHVAAERVPGAPARCRAAEQDFTLADAFGVQHERLLAALVRGVEAGLHEELRRPGAAPAPHSTSSAAGSCARCSAGAPTTSASCSSSWRRCRSTASTSTPTAASCTSRASPAATRTTSPPGPPSRCAIACSARSSASSTRRTSRIWRACAPKW